MPPLDFRRALPGWVGKVWTLGADGPPSLLLPGTCESGQGAFLSRLYPRLSPENPIIYLLGPR